MARPKGYDFQKRYRETIWNLIPSKRPGGRYNAIYREAHKQLPTLSKSTFRDYFRELPTIRDEDGGYRQDPEITREEDPYELQRFRGQVSDYWDDPKISAFGNDFGNINRCFNAALSYYVWAVNRVLKIGDKAKARQVLADHLNLRVGQALELAAVVAWRNRRKIVSTGGLFLRVDRELLKGSIV